MESEACFVPDSSYKLLDDVVEESIQRSKAAFASGNLTAAQKATAVSTIVGEVLESRGFVLWIPTESLGDALWKRGQPGEADRYIFDCDTGSMVLLTVAENLSMKAALVDITLTSGNGHNYVRWQLPGGQSLDWDMNLRSPCKTPENLPYYEGRSMTPDQVKAYALALRAGIWEGKRDFVQALKDYKTAMVLDKEQPISLNNFAWMVATKSFATRKDYVDDALAASEHLLSLNRTPNYLDTRACAQALKGDFAAAIHTQREAVAGAPMKTGFRDRLAGFEATTPRDCTGHT